jgi:hypothetical protein
MITFTDIQKNAEGALATHVEGAPDGHFYATAKVFGYLTNYLLEGVKNDPDAVVKSFYYVSNGLNTPRADAHHTGRMQLRSAS